MQPITQNIKIVNENKTLIENQPQNRLIIANATKLTSNRICWPIYFDQAVLLQYAELHSNLDLGVVLVSRELTPKSREILNQGFTNSGQNESTKSHKRFYHISVYLQAQGLTFKLTDWLLLKYSKQIGNFECQTLYGQQIYEIWHSLAFTWYMYL